MGAPLEESPHMMRRQLKFIDRLFITRFGKAVLSLLREQPQISLAAYHDAFGDFVRSYLRLCDSEQGFLVHVCTSFVLLIYCCHIHVSFCLFACLSSVFNSS